VIARKLSLSALFIFITVLALAQYTPATVPNNKLVTGSYVSNPDHLIGESTVAEIDSILAKLEKQTTAQVAVVVMKSIGDANDADFAQELFTLWGVGASNNNGLLILLVDSPHTIRFHTGLQLEAVLPDVVCNHIQREKMLPSFKEGNYDQGLLNGINEVNKILTNPGSAEEIKAQNEDVDVGMDGLVAFYLMVFAPVFFITWAVKKNRFFDSNNPAHTDYPQMRLKRMTWLIEFGVIPLLILVAFWFSDSPDAGGMVFWVIYLYLMATVFHRLVRERRMFSKLKAERKYYEITEYLRQTTWYWFFIGLVFPVPFLFYFPFHFVRKAIYRNHPRKCLLCQGSMKKLSEKDEDEFLSKTQLVEENIRSVNYDVWKCKECGGTEAWYYLNHLTDYEVCPSCKGITYYLERNKTVKPPTKYNSGTGESIYRCKACNKKDSKPYSIAPRHTSSSSSSSSSGGSSYGGGSSSSGGSWGGGRSGGGGASNTW
jgi:uncharacterized protein